ncbi:MAG: hypothetical protein ACTSWL_03250 [Promethearchaeota archaeon]
MKNHQKSNPEKKEINQYNYWLILWLLIFKKNWRERREHEEYFLKSRLKLQKITYPSKNLIGYIRVNKKNIAIRNVQLNNPGEISFEISENKLDSRYSYVKSIPFVFEGRLSLFLPITFANETVITESKYYGEIQDLEIISRNTINAHFFCK